MLLWNVIGSNKVMNARWANYSKLILRKLSIDVGWMLVKNRVKKEEMKSGRAGALNN